MLLPGAYQLPTLPPPSQTEKRTKPDVVKAPGWTHELLRFKLRATSSETPPQSCLQGLCSRLLVLGRELSKYKLAVCRETDIPDKKSDSRCSSFLGLRVTKQSHKSLAKFWHRFPVLFCACANLLGMTPSARDQIVSVQPHHGWSLNCVLTAQQHRVTDSHMGTGVRASNRASHLSTSLPSRRTFW